MTEVEKQASTRIIKESPAKKTRGGYLTQYGFR